MATQASEPLRWFLRAQSHDNATETAALYWALQLQVVGVQVSVLIFSA